MPRKRAVRDAGKAENPALTPSPEVSALLDRPNKLLTPEQFFAATAAYAPRDATAFYIYRSWPVIDRKQGPNGPEAKLNIDKVMEPFDADWLLKKWGSGDYKLCFTDASKPRGHSQVCYTNVSLRDEAFAPVLDQAELVEGDSKNKGYIEGLRARGLWHPDGDKEGEMSKEAIGLVRELIQQQPAQRPNPSDALVGEVIRDTVAWALKTADPSASIEKIAAIFREQNNGGAGEILKVLLEQQAKQQEIVLKMIESSRPAAAANPASLTGSLEELLKMRKLLSQLGLGDSGGSWVSELASQAPVLLMLITQAAAAFRGGAPQSAPAAPAPPMLGAPAEHPSNVVEMPKPPQAGAPGASLQEIAFKVLRAMQRGFSGDDFATAVALEYGDEVYEQLRQIGVDNLIAALKSDPTIWASFAPVEPQLAQFVGEFVSYGDEPAAVQEPAA